MLMFMAREVTREVYSTCTRRRHAKPFQIVKQTCRTQPGQLRFHKCGDTFLLLFLTRKASLVPLMRALSSDFFCSKIEASADGL